MNTFTSAFFVSEKEAFEHLKGLFGAELCIITRWSKDGGCLDLKRHHGVPCRHADSGKRRIDVMCCSEHLSHMTCAKAQVFTSMDISVILPHHQTLTTTAPSSLFSGRLQTN